MAHDMAIEIVNQVRTMQHMDDYMIKHNRRIELLQSRILVEIGYINYEDEENDPFVNEYTSFKLSKIGDDIYWVCTDRENDIRVVNLSKHIDFVKFMAASHVLLSPFELEQFKAREGMNVSIWLPREHANPQGEKHTCFSLLSETFAFGKDKDLEYVIKQAIEIVRRIDIM